MSSYAPLDPRASSSTSPFGLLSRAEAASPNADLDLKIRKHYNQIYPNYLWWLIATFIALIAIFQLASWVISKSSSRASLRKEATDAETGRNSPAAHRRFSWRHLPSALANAFRVVAFRWSLNIGNSYTLNFAEVAVTCAYIIALFIWTFINTTNLEGEKFDPYYYTDRAAVIAVSQFPLITALGTKNNIVAYITGISYDKLNYIHRMTARVVFVLLWVHAGGKLPFFVLRPAIFEERFIQVGMVALIAFSILIVVSLRPIRAQSYEVFYFTHFLMVLIMLIGGYFHAEMFKHGKYIWPSFLVWGLDRFIRLVRLVYYNHLYFGFSTKGDRLDASVELLSPHFVRLHIHRPSHFSWTPGQTAFLTMPTVSGFPLEAHPFTIASVDSHYQLTGVKTPATTDVEKPELNVTPYWKELVFLINVREGFTKRLAAIAQKGEKVKVLVDGPYGFAPNLDADDTVVLVAGGSGVTFTLSTFLGVLSHVQNRKSRCRKLIFVWAIRDASHIEWISQTLTKALELAPSELEIAIRIYVTDNNANLRGAFDQTRTWSEDDSIHSSNEGTNTAGKPSRAASLLNFSAVQVLQGRPDLAALLQDEVDANAGRLSVTVCGSQGIARACRKALRVPLSTALNGGPSVVLHVESFGYA